MKQMINLKALIRIVMSSGRNKIIWKQSEELLNQIKNIHSSFEDSDEALNSPEVITNSILQMSDRINLYQKAQIDVKYILELVRDKTTLDEVEVLKRMPENEVNHIENLKRIIEKRNLEESKKEGSFIIELNEDELYYLFSLNYYREKKLTKLLK